jgi:hypothetical protein
MVNTNSGHEWMKTELSELIEQLRLDEFQKRALRSRWLDQIVWMPIVMPRGGEQWRQSHMGRSTFYLAHPIWRLGSA